MFFDTFLFACSVQGGACCTWYILPNIPIQQSDRGWPSTRPQRSATSQKTRWQGSRADSTRDSSFACVLKHSHSIRQSLRNSKYLYLHDWVSTSQQAVRGNHRSATASYCTNDSRTNYLGLVWKMSCCGVAGRTRHLIWKRSSTREARHARACRGRPASSSRPPPPPSLPPCSSRGNP